MIARRNSPRTAPPRLRRLRSAGRYDVYLVDGLWTREHYYLDFAQGGNGLRYRFIPDGEIWVDDGIRPEERDAVILHEAVEADLMRNGLSYLDAHAEATRQEADFRRVRLPPEARMVRDHIGGIS